MQCVHFMELLMSRWSLHLHVVSSSLCSNLSRSFVDLSIWCARSIASSLLAIQSGYACHVHVCFTNSLHSNLLVSLHLSSQEPTGNLDMAILDFFGPYLVLRGWARSGSQASTAWFIRTF